MSGSYVNAAGPTINADMAAVASGVSAAAARAENAQTDAAAFISQHGAAVNNGHSAVGYRPPDAEIGA